MTEHKANDHTVTLQDVTSHDAVKTQPTQPTQSQRFSQAFTHRLRYVRNVFQSASASEWRHFLIAGFFFTTRLLIVAFIIWFITMMILIVVFRFVNPPGSALMLIRGLSGVKVEQNWVNIEKISPNLIRTVIASEDGRFCHHWGIDPRELLAAIRRSRNGTPRGASTITMQLAKNMFLWPAKSYVRKALELPLTVAIELTWPKRRIMEVYLNIVEWGPGIFGVRRAARYHFGLKARQLQLRQAALLAVSLPNPLRRRAGAPGPGLSRLAGVIMNRARRNRAAAACVLRRR